MQTEPTEQLRTPTQQPRPGRPTSTEQRARRATVVGRRGDHREPVRPTDGPPRPPGRPPTTAAWPPPVPDRPSGPHAPAIVLGLVCLAVAVIVLAQEVGSLSVDWGDVGPLGIVATGAVLVLFGLVGLLTSRRNRRNGRAGLTDPAADRDRPADRDRQVTRAARRAPAPSRRGRQPAPHVRRERPAQVVVVRARRAAPSAPPRSTRPRRARRGRSAAGTTRHTRSARRGSPRAARWAPGRSSARCAPRAAGPRSTSWPLSSHTSRCRAATGASPGSSPPPGRVHRPGAEVSADSSVSRTPRSLVTTP